MKFMALSGDGLHLRRIARAESCRCHLPPSPIFPSPPNRLPKKISNSRLIVFAANSDSTDVLAMEQDIEASTVAVDEMVREVTKSLFIDTATAYVTGEAATRAALQQVIQTAVTPRLESLNATFLPVLNSYIEATSQRGEDERDIVSILIAIKGEVLSQLSQRLPPEMQIIQKALESTNSEERVKGLRESLFPASGASPPCDPGTLALTVARMIQDFEGNDQAAEREDEEEFVPDRALVARLCLLREELRELSDEAQMRPTEGTAEVQGSTNEDGALKVDIMGLPKEEERTNLPGASASPYTALRGVPAREVAFLKELMAVESSERRRALLEACFRGDVAAVGVTGAGVRPGAFMDCIKALQTEMLGPMYAQGGGPSESVLVRLENVWREAVVVLEDISGAKYSP